MRRLNYLFFIVLSVVCNGHIQIARGEDSSVIFLTEDIDIFNRYLCAMDDKKELSFNHLIIETALFLKGTPYVASTLESEKEQLIVNLRGLDCTTFVENVIALAYTVKGNDPSFTHFCDYLRVLRYRNRCISDYTDWLHYFSDWIYENERAGFVKDMTRQMGGISHLLHLSFMSSHPENYPALKKHPEFIETMRLKEQEISARDVYAIIPKANIDDFSEAIRDGDIVCFVTNIEGLDVTHVGFAYRRDGILTFIHASSIAKEVIIDPKSLRQYAENVASTVGVMIVRPQQ